MPIIDRFAEPAIDPRAAMVAAKAAEQILKRRRTRASLLAWCQHVLEPLGQAPALHHRLLISELTRVAATPNDRLIVAMPPGSAKSTYVSTLFPAWWFAQHPRSCMIAGSHTFSLAQRFGKKVRNLVAEHESILGYTLSADSQAAGQWETSAGGEYLAAGVDGAVVGRRADLVVIDDPIKSAKEASSELIRENTWGWYKDDVYSRLKPGGRVVVVMTRYHEDDLVGRLRALDEAGQGDNFRVLELKAFAEKNDPLFRDVGDALWPEWEDAEALYRKQRMHGARMWSALYQQNPVPGDGALFQPEKISILNGAPPLTGKVIRAWDLAATEQTGGQNPDWTVGIKMMRDEMGRIIILDVFRNRGSPMQVNQWLANTARLDGPYCTVGLPKDPAQSGKFQFMYLTGSVLAGYIVKEIGLGGSKEQRAGPIASQVEAGNVFMVRAPWNQPLIEELRAFPLGTKDDQVDALSGGSTLLMADAKRGSLLF